MKINPPKNLLDLQQRCQQLTGQPLSSLAAQLNLEPPTDLLRAKGWIGQLLETYLGATASSKAMPDFAELGVELKTIPVSNANKPLESTYVCTVQTNQSMLNWRDSWVYHKLKHVLWVPILSSRTVPITERTILQPILWQMPAEIENILRTDWEELMDMLQVGYATKLSAKFGTFLHIRPKAANSSVLIDYVDADGHSTKIVPKGFYLRPSFTSMILNANI